MFGEPNIKSILHHFLSTNKSVEAILKEPGPCSIRPLPICPPLAARVLILFNVGRKSMLGVFSQASHLPWPVNNVSKSSNFASPLVSCDSYTLVALTHVHVVQALRIT